MILQCMKTYSATPKDHEIQWYILDAKDLVLGRLAVRVAMMLRGKHKATYTPHMQTGDRIIIVNAEKVHLTGKKFTNKKYYRHTGFPGGIKEITPEKLVARGRPEEVIRLAVERMMPKESPLARQQLKNLRIYAGEKHPHEGQHPKVLDFASQNVKNTLRKNG